MKRLSLILAVIFFSASAHAETIQLKSGKTITGKIIEQTDQMIKIDPGVGVGITYFRDDIENIVDTPSSDGTTKEGNINSNTNTHTAENVISEMGYLWKTGKTDVVISIKEYPSKIVINYSGPSVKENEKNQIIQRSNELSKNQYAFLWETLLSKVDIWNLKDEIEESPKYPNKFECYFKKDGKEIKASSNKFYKNSPFFKIIALLTSADASIDGTKIKKEEYDRLPEEKKDLLFKATMGLTLPLSGF